jgi:hypothetical protein
MSSDDYARVFNIVGLAFTLIGILTLFRWGMPFHVESRGEVFLVTGAKDARDLAIRRRGISVQRQCI